MRTANAAGIRDLELHNHGYELIHLKGDLEICRDDHLYLTGEESNDRAEIGRFSSSDYDSIKRFEAMLAEYVEAFDAIRTGLEVGNVQMPRVRSLSEEMPYLAKYRELGRVMALGADVSIVWTFFIATQFV